MKRTLYYLLFSCLLVNLCHGCLNFTNHNVTFNATNFEYVLQWNKVYLPSDVLFSVQYKRYGQNGWSLFPECQHITEVYCNLTNAITGDVEDFMEHQYFGRVQALSRNCSSDWVMSKRLNPRDDTFLILPKLNYIEHINSVTILVPTPTLGLRSKDNKPMTMEELYKDHSFQYHLRFFDAEQRELLQEPQKQNKFEVSGLSPNTEYIGSIYIMIGDKQKSDAQNFVVRTLPDHSLIILIVILIANFAVVLGIVMLYLSCKYIRHQAITPNSLDFKKVTRIQFKTERKEKYSSCTMGFSPSMFPQTNYSECKDQSENVLQIPCAGKFGTSYLNQTSISNTDSPLLSHASFNVQQNNKKTDSSVHYGALFEDISVGYQPKHIPDILNKTSYNSQSEFQLTAHQPLDKDNGTLNELQNNGDTFPLLLSLFNQKPIGDLDISQGLMSSVVVSDELMGQREHTETPVLPEVQENGFFPELPNDPAENNVSENRLPQHGSDTFRLQYPVEESQHSSINGTFIYEQPYRLQH